MDNKPKSKYKSAWSYISNVLSWTTFVLLLICALLLIYYFFAMQIYARKGSGYEPAFSLYTIVSPSMTPNIKVYDVVVDVKVKNPEDIAIGDVITFNSNNPNLVGKTITHRVIAITKDKDGNYLYQTKGDANLIEDDKPVPYNLIVGKVAIRIPQLGRVQFILASSMGWMILILIPSLYIIIKDIIKLIKISKMSEEEYAEYVKNLKNKKNKNTSNSVDNNVNVNVNVTVNTPISQIIDDAEEEFDTTELPTLKDENMEDTIKNVEQVESKDEEIKTNEEAKEESNLFESYEEIVKEDTKEEISTKTEKTNEVNKNEPNKKKTSYSNKNRNNTNNSKKKNSNNGNKNRSNQSNYKKNNNKSTHK